MCVLDYTVWTHHGETTVINGDNNDQEEDALLYQYTNEVDEDMGYDPDNEQGADFGNQQCADDAGGAGADGRAREGGEDDGDHLQSGLSS
jgi:hypothetical protein